MATTLTKLPISSLPLPPPTHLLVENLTPDENTPSVSAFRKLLSTIPSVQRRARLLNPQSHFSYVSPFPVQFPYHISSPNPPEVIHDKAAWVEKWLSDREAIHPPSATDSLRNLTVYYPKNRDQNRELIGLSETGLKDCLPLLDVGDAFATLGTPSLIHSSDDDMEQSSEADISARQELVDVLSGHCLLMSAEPGPTEDQSHNSFAPWSLRYSGHQFGSWAGQLGDGRAISVRELDFFKLIVASSCSFTAVVTPHPSDPDLTYELQLKGAGRTPFSRFADGLAVVRSSIREFLCAEGIVTFHIQTSHLSSFP
jgi:hypothetical protein